MRANRLMGANRVDANLVKIDDLEKANERLLELVASGQPRQNTVLGILCYEMKVVREENGGFVLDVTDVGAELSFKTKEFTIKRDQKVALKAHFEANPDSFWSRDEAAGG